MRCAFLSNNNSEMAEHILHEDMDTIHTVAKAIKGDDLKEGKTYYIRERNHENKTRWYWGTVRWIGNLSAGMFGHVHMFEFEVHALRKGDSSTWRKPRYGWAEREDEEDDMGLIWADEQDRVVDYDEERPFVPCKARWRAKVNNVITEERAGLCVRVWEPIV